MVSKQKRNYHQRFHLLDTFVKTSLEAWNHLQNGHVNARNVMKEIFEEVQRYIRIKRTDSSHYGDKDVQVIDLLKSTGDVNAFCRGNAIKYVARWGVKTDETNVEDLYKAIHYIMILLENQKIAGDSLFSEDALPH